MPLAMAALTTLCLPSHSGILLVCCFCLVQIYFVCGLETFRPNIAKKEKKISEGLKSLSIPSLPQIWVNTHPWTSILASHWRQRGARKEQPDVYKSGLASRTPLPGVGLLLTVGACVVGRHRPGLG